jgi:phage tail-like protein
VDVFNEANQKALSYNLYRCWVSEYQALPDLDASANAVAITTLKLEYEWFERDIDVVEAAGPARIG